MRVVGTREGEDGKTVAVSGRLVPGYVMLLPDGTDMTASLSELLPNATWSKLMTEDERQLLFRLPTNTTGRYIRVQLTSTDPNDYLSLAEVQAYRKGTPSHAACGGLWRHVFSRYPLASRTQRRTLSARTAAVRPSLKGVSTAPKA